MKNMQEACKVSIFGEQYTIVSDEQIDRIVKAAQLVDAMMHEGAQAGASDIKRLAVLVALKCANMALCKEEDNELILKCMHEMSNTIDHELASRDSLS